MVQSPSWEANWFAASQEIPRISWNPKVHYRTHKRPPPVSILDQPNPVHISTSHLLEIHPNIIHPCMPRSPQWSLSVRFPHQDPIHPLSSPIRYTCPAHLILLDFITRTILGEEYKSFSSSLCNLLHFPVRFVASLHILLFYYRQISPIHVYFGPFWDIIREKPNNSLEFRFSTYSQTILMMKPGGEDKVKLIVRYFKS